MRDWLVTRGPSCSEREARKSTSPVSSALSGMFRMRGKQFPQASWGEITIPPQCILERVGSDGDVALVAQQSDDGPLTCCDGQAVDDLDVTRIEWAPGVGDGSRRVLPAVGDNHSV